MYITFLIPCLNEATTITRVVQQAHAAGKKYSPGSFEVLVADNGSTDKSLKKLAAQGIARIIHVPVRGYGAALHWGIHRAHGKFVMYADADLSYDFREVRVFLSAMKIADLILGSRFLGKIHAGAMPSLHRYFGTPMLTMLIRFLYHLPVSDCNSGMRMVRRKFYQSLPMHNSGMEWASELLIKTALHKGRYAEVPISLHKDQRKRAPHLLSWIDGWRHLKAIVLLRPSALFILSVSLLLLAAFLEPIRIFLSMAAFALLLSTFAAQILQFAIDETPSLTAKVVQKIPIVPTILAANCVVVGMLIFFPNTDVTAKTLCTAVVIILDVWVFHLETIKTHVMYRLPGDLSPRGQQRASHSP